MSRETHNCDYHFSVRPFLLITTREDIASAAGEYQLYRTLTGLPAESLVWIGEDHARLHHLSPTDFSGVLIAGSPYTHSDTSDQKTALQHTTEAAVQHFLQRTLHDRVPYFGVCYGLGALARTVGAVIDRSYPEDSGIAAISVTTEAVTDPIFGPLPATFDAFVGHKECVPNVPTEAILLASSPRCPVQAVRYRDNAYATQFHPELTVRAFQQRVLESASLGYFAPDEMTHILDRAQDAQVAASHQLLQNFVTQFASPAEHARQPAS